MRLCDHFGVGTDCDSYRDVSPNTMSWGIEMENWEGKGWMGQVPLTARFDPE
ncbi:hypothetical protein SAMN04487950_4581 [Halogranum rubrum]|uniref:Uncharacterized protein n=1 Tax=Halogranum rubrum TaxID=553466 RepID=A0A1I4JMK2_9EURY|nr:hypothetical protein SAMN04487950_4581 [Halogranum rubrum]